MVMGFEKLITINAKLGNTCPPTRRNGFSRNEPFDFKIAVTDIVKL